MPIIIVWMRWKYCHNFGSWINNNFWIPWALSLWWVCLMHCKIELCKGLVDNKQIPLIARLMGPTWGPSGADRTQVAPCWPHELCYLELIGIIAMCHQATSHYLIQQIFVKLSQFWSIKLWSILYQHSTLLIWSPMVIGESKTKTAVYPLNETVTEWNSSHRMLCCYWKYWRLSNWQSIIPKIVIRGIARWNEGVTCLMQQSANSSFQKIINSKLYNAYHCSGFSG